MSAPREHPGPLPVDDAFDLLTLALLPDVGPGTVQELRARVPARQVLLRPDEHADLVPARARALILSGAARRRAEDERGRCAQAGIAVIGRDDAAYPGHLRQVYDPPPVLYVRGSMRPDEGPKSVAIVGSRAATPHGRALARSMARELAGAGATVVSGLARGIDAAAHRGALDAGGRTVAVLGSGLDHVYPPENAPLAVAIAERGAVVSEFPLGTVPYPGHFPRRNRIIAGWSQAVVVVEAAARSGALVTARVALEEGRDVFAVPGHPSHPSCAGCNQLIRDGAPLVRDALDVAREMGLGFEVAPESEPGDHVLRALRGDAPSSLEELRERCGLETPALLARLTELEMADKVRRLPGALFLRA
jgi:DNA processing protein